MVSGRAKTRGAATHNDDVKNIRHNRSCDRPAIQGQPSAAAEVYALQRARSPKRTMSPRDREPDNAFGHEALFETQSWKTLELVGDGVHASRARSARNSGLGKGALKYEVKKQNDNEGYTH